MTVVEMRRPAAEAAAQGKPALSVQGIERRFGGLVAVTGVDLEIMQGEIFGLVGPNGSGKTTLTNAITGFYPPNKGRILLGERDVTGMAPHRIAGLGVARTFQNLALFNGLTVLENILLGRHIHMRPSVWRTALYWWAARPEEIANRMIVEEVIEFLQLESIRDELVDGIPIGLKKRVELARALVAEPSFLILDEPMAGMNQEEKEYMARFILDARDARGVTVLLIEHHMDVILGICDRMLVLNYGEMIASGIPPRWWRTRAWSRPISGAAMRAEAVEAQAAQDTLPALLIENARAHGVRASPCARRTAASGRRSPGPASPRRCSAAPPRWSLGVGEGDAVLVLGDNRVRLYAGHGRGGGAAGLRDAGLSRRHAG